jgi:NADH-quinone oxidoreductase subunit M
MIANMILISLIVAIFNFIIWKKAKLVRWIIFSALLTYLVFQLSALYGNWNYSETHTFLKGGGINFVITFHNYPLGWFFAFFTTLLNLTISIFSLYKNVFEKEEMGINVLWSMLAGANLMIFFSADWLTFYIAWEYMTWTSFFIITPGWKKSFKAATYYFVLSMLGTVAMLIGIWWLYGNAGTFNIQSTIKYLISLWSTNGLAAGTIISLFVAAFFAKSSIFPFHLWPAEAHAEAPDDFSPYLSGIMIKYGVYGILLFIIPVLAHVNAHATVNGIPVLAYTFAWFGAVTAVVGAFLALISSDMKRLAAFSTVSNLGYVVTAIFILTPLGFSGGLFHVVNHAVFKSAIFIALAAVKFRTHEREMYKLGGLATKMPITFLTFLIGIIGAAGIPPINGYASKWMIYQSLLQGRFPFLTIMIFIASTMAFMYLFRALHSVFLGQLPRKFKDVKEVPIIMQIPMFILMATMYVIGTYPGLVLKPINVILSNLGFHTLNVTTDTIVGKFSSMNGRIISNVFIASFIIGFIIYLMGKKRHHVEPLDNYTAGQNPKDFGLTPELYHFAKDFYKPFRDKLAFFEKHMSVYGLYQGFVNGLNSFGATMANMFKGTPRSASIYFTIGFVILIIVGWLA